MSVWNSIPKASVIPDFRDFVFSDGHRCSMTKCLEVIHWQRFGQILSVNASTTCASTKTFYQIMYAKTCASTKLCAHFGFHLINSLRASSFGKKRAHAVYLGAHRAQHERCEAVLYDNAEHPNTTNRHHRTNVRTRLLSNTNKTNTQTERTRLIYDNKLRHRG
jgi:hypothetical protein